MATAYPTKPQQLIKAAIRAAQRKRDPGRLFVGCGWISNGHWAVRWAPDDAALASVPAEELTEAMVRTFVGEPTGATLDLAPVAFHCGGPVGPVYPITADYGIQARYLPLLQVGDTARVGDDRVTVWREGTLVAVVVFCRL